MQIEIIQADIDKANDERARGFALIKCCPIAQAFLRTGHNSVAVHRWAVLADGHCFKMEHDAIVFASSYDHRQAVTPTTVTLRLLPAHCT